MTEQTGPPVPPPQPPPPPPAPPAVPPVVPPATPPPAPAHATRPPVAPPTPRRSTRWPWILGCGCLGLLLVLAASAFFGYRYWQHNIQPRILTEIQATEQSPTAPTEPANTTRTAPPATPTAPAVTEKPSKEKAVRAALAETTEKDWVAKVVYASGDWQRVKVWVGPPRSEFTTAITLQWDPQDNVYNVVRVETLPSPGEPKANTPPTPPKTVTKATAPPTTTVKRPPGAPKPPVKTTGTTEISGASGTRSNEGPVPSARRAIAKVLAKAPEKGWVAKVVRRNADWTEATIMIGPPQSEFVAEVDVRWDWSVRRYNIVGTRPLGEG